MTLPVALWDRSIQGVTGVLMELPGMATVYVCKGMVFRQVGMV